MTNAQPRLRPVLAGIPAYAPGKPAAPIEGLASFKISSNENPFPPLPGVLAAAVSAAEEMNRYPDYAGQPLVDALADYLGVPAEQVVLGPGSVGVLGQLLAALCDAGDEVVFAWRSFEAYPILAQVVGARPVMVPLTSDHRHDLPAMAAAVTERTRVILVCTPNNPTGTTVTADELDSFLDAVPPHVLVVIDEAYLEFDRASDTPDALAVMRSRPNVAVLRTFSKAYGLAGLRVGYAVARPVIAAGLRKTMVPFSVSTIAQCAGVESLAQRAALTQRVDALVAERERVLSGLRAQGWDVPDTQANFVWLPLADRALEFHAACAAKALAVRPFAGEGVRCSIGEEAANTRLLEICGQWRQ